MRLVSVVTAGTIAVLCGLGSIAAASAADMPLYDAPNTAYPEPMQPLEFGTGWYLRGDAAYAQEDHPAFNAKSLTFDTRATSSGYAFGVGAGYKFTSFVRVDVTGDFLDPFDYSAEVACGIGCSTTNKDHVWRWAGLANGYLDLGTWYGFTPYVGAGVGVGVTREDMRSTTTAGGLGTVSTMPKSHDDYQLAWAGMAGVSYVVTPHTMIDIGYRYLDLGKATIQLKSIASTQRELTEHQVRVGLRYMVD